ncbi:hypothetical protein [Methanosphaerula palustris]|uniref:Uncharacterized protein n=1 Tax=Methanosphaerula palustris (strain ATCC BAA-1556 / DSM 19958 / E1-9c) TaxID=521011 RepID=B8GK33_METPE|nr:hypothetical protein [Methanosphaerula palustris]ACL17104.1 hypothetical protein Mpal_1798 [Methanosphaerula palustris E1-9c]
MTKHLRNLNYRASLSVLISFALILLALTITVPVGAESVLPDHYHINLAMANGGERYLKFDGGGLNALHISSDSSNYGGNSIASDSQSGSFFLTDTGGRGFDDDGILMLAVKGDVPDDFSVHIRASGYTWTPSTVINQKPEEITYQDGSVDSTFTKSDFAYGPQNWRPAGPENYPIYDGQDMSDSTQQFHLMFIDLHAGILGQGSVNTSAPPLTDNGAIRVEYSFSNLNSFAAFNTYAWCLNSNQGEGISWTNRLSEAGSSGVTVKGIEPTLTTVPTTTEPTTTTTTPNTTVSVSPTETPTSVETTVNATPTVIVNTTEPTSTTMVPVTTLTTEPTTSATLTTVPTSTTTIKTTPTTSATVTVAGTATVTSTQTAGTVITTSAPVTTGTTAAVTVSQTTAQPSLTVAPSVTTTQSPEPSVSVPVLSTLFPSHVQTAVPTQAATSGSQVASSTSGAWMVGATVPPVQATVTSQSTQTVASSATTVQATVSSGSTQTIATQSSSPSTGSTSSNSAGGPVSTGDSSSGSSSDDYTGVGGTVGTTATPAPTTATPTQTQSADTTPTPTLVNTSTPVMTTPTLPLIDTGNQNEYSPVSISGSSGAASSRDQSSSQNFLSMIQSTIDRLSSSDLSLLLLIGAALLFALLVFAGLIIMILLLLLLVIGLLYLRQRRNLKDGLLDDLQEKD